MAVDLGFPFEECNHWDSAETVNRSPTIWPTVLLQQQVVINDNNR